MKKMLVLIGVILMFAGVALAEEAKEYKPLDLGDAKVSAVPDAVKAKFMGGGRRSRFDPNFYTKYLDVGGVTVMGTDKVRDEAFYEVRYLASNVLSNRKDILDAMAERNTRLVIIAYEEEVSTLPEYYIEDPVRAEQQNRRVRGYGGATLTSFGEENLLTYPRDRYNQESIMIHEFGHCIDSHLRRMDPDWSNRLGNVYRDARAQGLWDNTYGGSNQAEYWAEGIQAYFDCCKRSRTGEPDGVYNHVGNREELEAYDPGLFNLIEKTVGPVDWRYTRYDARYPDRPVDERGITSTRSTSAAAANTTAVQQGTGANAGRQRGVRDPNRPRRTRGRRGTDPNSPQ